MSGGSGSPSGPDSRVETISRLAQWRIDTFGPCSYRRSDPFKLGIWNWYHSSFLPLPNYHLSPILHAPKRNKLVKFDRNTVRLDVVFPRLAAG